LAPGLPERRRRTVIVKPTRKMYVCTLPLWEPITDCGEYSSDSTSDCHRYYRHPASFHDLGNILKPCRKKGSGFEDQVWIELSQKMAIWYEVIVLQLCQNAESEAYHITMGSGFLANRK
jgi:hypothetical protein